MTEERVEIYGLDAIDIIKLVRRKTNKYLAIALSDIEEENLSDDDYTMVRKIVLDSFNELSRSILRAILGGDIEGRYYYEDV